MNLKNTLSNIFFLSLATVTNICFASNLSCENIVLGDYVKDVSEDSMFRIEKINGNIVSRKKISGEWESNFEDVVFITKDELKKFLEIQDESVLQNSCGVNLTDIGILLKLPVGFNYKYKLISEKTFETKKLKTDYLLYSNEAGAFDIKTYELYKVRSKDTSPNPKKEEIIKIIKGSEVPTTPVCAGNRLPDMSQQDFNNMPKEYIPSYVYSTKKSDERARLSFFGGQNFSTLLSRSYNANTTEIERKKHLSEIYTFLHANQIPRDSYGNEDWWHIASYILRQVNQNSTDKPSYQQEYRKLFYEEILPKLYIPDETKVNHFTASEQIDFTRFFIEMLYLEPREAMELINKVNANNILQLNTNSKRFPIFLATDVLRFTYYGEPYRERPKITSEMFKFFLRESGEKGINDGLIMQEVINSENIIGFKILLEAGAKLSSDDLILINRYPKMLNILEGNNFKN